MHRPHPAGRRRHPAGPRGGSETGSAGAAAPEPAPRSLKARSLAARSLTTRLPSSIRPSSNRPLPPHCPGACACPAGARTPPAARTADSPPPPATSPVPAPVSPEVACCQGRQGHHSPHHEPDERIHPPQQPRRAHPLAHGELHDVVDEDTVGEAEFGNGQQHQGNGRVRLHRCHRYQSQEERAKQRSRRDDRPLANPPGKPWCRYGTQEPPCRPY
jgi:hypothetical protein